MTPYKIEPIFFTHEFQQRADTNAVPVYLASDVEREYEGAANTVARVQALEASIRDVCGPELNCLSNMNIGFVEKAVTWYQQQLTESHANLHAQRLATYQAVEREHAAKKQIAELKDALEACTEGFSQPSGSSLLVRSQVYAILAKFKLREAQP